MSALAADIPVLGVGRLALLGDVLERYGRDAVVLFFSTGHYRQPLRFSDGKVICPDGPGLGVDVDEEKLRHYALADATATA